MRCYYEELCIPQDSSDADIKTAYRKLALRWHPDKNLDCSVEAKERFQLIQTAYEVLSDPQERAWYDRHRDEILRQQKANCEDKCLDIFEFFTVSCFKGFGDDKNGFYSTYRSVFQIIATEDSEFVDDENYVDTIPGFGDSNSDYETVVGPFYAYWQAYNTKRTYEWLCEVDLREVRDRYVMRMIQKELNKTMQKARKERSEEVRNLVSFVRKRDPRVKAYKLVLEDRAESNRQKQEAKRIEQIRKRQQEFAAVKEHRKNDALFAGYEEQLAQLEQQYNSSDSKSDEDDDNADDTLVNEDGCDYIDELYCVACNKSFKNVNAFANHEESKKHRDNVAQLKSEMLAEEAAHNGSFVEKEKKSESNEDDDELQETVEQIELDVKDLDLNKPEESLEENSETIETPPATQARTTKRDKKAKKTKRANKINATQLTCDTDYDDEDMPDTHTHTLGDKAEQHDSSDSDVWETSKKNSKKNKAKKQTNSKRDKEEKKAKMPVLVESSVVTVALEAASHQHICVTCQAAFESKNKLFAHLKKTNHGVYIPKPTVENTAPPKAKGRRGK